jgi:hypothetical protein
MILILAFYYLLLNYDFLYVNNECKCCTNGENKNNKEPYYSIEMRYMVLVSTKENYFLPTMAVLPKMAMGKNYDFERRD